MLENINLKQFPHKSGVYLFKVNERVVYIGSSKNLCNRMRNHRFYIKKGSNHGHKQDLYQFLQSNQFTIEFQLTDDYRQLEQQLIEKHNPKYNANRAYANVVYNDNRAEYDKEYYQEHKEEKKQYNKQYKNQLCNYNGKTLTLNALSQRFRKKGIDHPQLEAKKYLI